MKSRRDVPAPRKFLPEVQGLRALAVLMVVSYHVWFGRVSGGVDIFLLISAFLLTGQFTRKLETGKALALLKYWAHLFKRLLPLIVLTLLATLVATYLFVPATRWSGIMSQAWASLTYRQNWFLASESVDYYASDHSLASPLQHFWSLSIQGQIFILWPLVFALAASISRKARLKVRPLLMYMFGAIFVASLAYSIVATSSRQEYAYFDTRARLWEFALGSLLALALPYLNFNRGTRIVLGWLGVVAMLACGIVLQVDQQFPGYIALWPTLAAAAVIVAGHTGSSVGADRFLSWKPLVKLGDSSYALYLFHWPVLVIFLIATGRDHAGPKAGLAIVLFSIVAAILATKWIDTPLRTNTWANSKRRRSTAVIVTCMLTVAVPLAGCQLYVAKSEKALLASADQNNPGAASLRPGFVDKAEPGAAMLPTLTSLDKQWVALGHSCTGDFAPTSPIVDKACGQSVVTGAASKKIVVLGDSHSQQWMGALIPVAKKYNWQLISVLKGGCTYSAEVLGPERAAACNQYNAAATDYVLKQRPDAVFTVSTAAVPDSPAETMRPGFVEAVTKFTKAGIEVVGVRDNARFNSNKANCVAKEGADACAFSQATNFAPKDPAAGLNTMPGAHMLDLTDRFCVDGTCGAVIGNVLVYLDHNHLTGEYTKTLAPDLEQRWFAATGWPKKT
jgi:peptidoglycan/LPS O-acetylase OafA/YrhL